jgi:FkbM family methyltransferase
VEGLQQNEKIRNKKMNFKKISSYISAFFFKINHSSLAHFKLRVWGQLMFSFSFDRTLYLFLHKIKIMGNKNKKVFSQYITQGMTVVDIGANVGIYTGLFSNLVGPSGKVISIEPAQDNWRALECAKAHNTWKNVEIHNVALSDRQEQIFLSYGLFNSGNTIASKHETNICNEQINAFTLDAILDGRRVDFIKIDVQGWEAAVLRGGQKTLMGNRPICVRLEILPFALKNANSSPSEVFSILEENGLSINEKKIYEKHRSQTNSSSYFGGYDVTFQA